MRQIARKIKTLAMAAIGRGLNEKPDLKCATVRIGSGYGGWNVISENIRPECVVYSFGVGEDASFDVGMIQKFGVKIHAFDPTPKSIEWVKRQGFPTAFVMHEYGIASFDGTVRFNPPEKADQVSHTLLDKPSTEARAIVVPVKKLTTIMKELGHDKIDILKMDIEGAEYDVLEDLLKSEIRPAQLLVEFHHRFPNVGVEKSKAAISRLRSSGYRLVSVSSTNEEFGFLYSPR